MSPRRTRKSTGTAPTRVRVSRRGTAKPTHLVPALARLIEAAEQRGGDVEGRDLLRVARALREFGELAWWIQPIHGVFVPNDDEISTIVERVAARHLGLTEVRTAFRKAVQDIEPFERRDAIESAHNHVRAIAEDAYFYAGLALGITGMTTS